MRTSPPVPPEIDPSRVPVHVAWVAAGSARWAAARGGSAAVLAAAEDRALLVVVDTALELGVRWLTVQEPSRGRPLLGRAASDLSARGVVVRVLGAEGIAPAPAPLREPPPTRGRPAGAPALTVTVADGYSGRGEIVGAVRALAVAGASPDEVDERAVGAHLWAPDMPDPDLLVRTGGDRRVPDLLLWEAAYSELVFIDDAWPDVGRDHVLGAVAEYQRRDRRYGGLVTTGGQR